jgi:hypothetical protein
MPCHFITCFARSSRLPEEIQEDRTTRSSACVQETDPRNVSCPLRLGPDPVKGECESGREDPHRFYILDFRF